MSHQSKWKKSVFEVYKDASIKFSWTKELLKECKKNKIDWFASSWDINSQKLALEFISKYLNGIQINKYKTNE